MDLISLFKYHQCNSYGFNALLEACLNIMEEIPFQVGNLNVKGIIRSRQNEEGELFNNAEQLSYNKDVYKVCAGRFNLKNQPIFYGSVPTFNKEGNYINYGSQVALFEVCKELKTNESLTFPSFFTVGNWETIEEIVTVSLCYDQDHLKENYGIEKSFSKLDSHLQLSYSIEEIDFIKQIWKYFSVLSRTWDNKNTNYYNVLTAFFIAIQEFYFEQHGTEIEAVVYPSAMTDAKGQNIALIPNAVNKKLRLSSVQMFALNHRGLPNGYKSISDKIKVENEQFQFVGKSVAEYRTFNIMKRLIDNNEQATPELKRELNELYRISESPMRFKC